MECASKHVFDPGPDIEEFRREVTEPACLTEDPLDRLKRVCENFLEYTIRKGGCFFSPLNMELDLGDKGVRDRIVQLNADWLRTLSALAASAQREGTVCPREDPEELAFELDALMQFAVSYYFHSRDWTVVERSRCAITTRLVQASTEVGIAGWVGT